MIQAIQLTKGLYMGSKPSDLFGLIPVKAQEKERILFNCSWFNKNGEKLGHGDLTKRNFIDIQKGIKNTDIFVICGEGSSEFKGIQPKEGEKISDLALKYISENAVYIIDSKNYYHIADKNYSGTLYKTDLTFKVINRGEAFQLVKELLMEVSHNSIIDA